MRSTEEQVFSADEMEGIALRYGAFYGQDSFTRMIINLVRMAGCRCPRPAAGSPTSSTWRTPPPQPWPPWRRGAPDRCTRRRRRAGALGRLPGRARRTRGPPAMAGPHLDAASDPASHTILTTSMRVSNAKARRELGWAPTVPTYREGIPLVAGPAAERSPSEDTSRLNERNGSRGLLNKDLNSVGVFHSLQSPMNYSFAMPLISPHICGLLATASTNVFNSGLGLPSYPAARIQVSMSCNFG